ncbi:hypothetical protein WIS52_11535 [Pseudonocardia nematodicida]|uniref:Uncharacterized protein n=1 Tax=Pseudonocardia nematodicida TaxID=1206997 RepID=A0ABV1KB58_9PSEU
MRISGPLLTLATVGAVGAGVLAANVVLTAEPGTSVVEQATGLLALDQEVPGEAATDQPGAAGPAPADAVYEGRSAGDEVTVSITVSDGAATARVRGELLDTRADGEIDPSGRTVLTSSGGDRVEYSVQDGTAFGTVTGSGRSWPFSAAAADDPAPAAAASGGGY